MSNAFYNDAWHRIAPLRVALLPSVVVQEQIFRTRIWYVLKDDCNESFYRISAETYRFIAELTPARTVQEIWEDYVERFPREAPSREDVVGLIQQLHASNLLYFQSDSNADEIARRIEETARKAWWSQITSFLYFRVPLVNPDAFLAAVDRRLPRWLIYVLLALWVLVIGWGGMDALDHAGELADKTQGLLAPSNLAWLYVCTALLKLLHELSHGLVCKRLGGRVRTLGVMFLIFTPLPFVDVTSAWGMARPAHRMRVGVAGMVAELFVAALAAIVWTHTGAGLVNSLCFNLMFVGSVSSLVFNGNPLLRFDAYYILSDYVGIPNLYARAQAQWLNWGKRTVFGVTDLEDPHQDRRETAILYVYGALSTAYLLMVTYYVTVMLLDQWFPIGVVALVTAVYTRLLMPLWSLLRFTHSAAVRFNPRRALAVGYGLPLLLVGLAVAVPLPNRLVAPGVLESRQFEIAYAQGDGRLVSLPVQSGARVHRGEVLAVLQSSELDERLRVNRDEFGAAQAQWQNLLYQGLPEAGAAQQRLSSLAHEYRDLLQRREQLTVRAAFDGWWEAPQLPQFLGDWVRRGAVLGQLVDTRGFRFSGVISQEQAQAIFDSTVRAGRVAVVGQSDHAVPLTDITVLPYDSTRLVSPALGWLGGGDLAVRQDDNSGTQAKDSYFLLRGELPTDMPPQVGTWMPLHGLSGKVELHLQPLSLWRQASLALRQMVQKRYAL